MNWGWATTNLRTLEQVVLVVVGAFALFVVIKFRDFVFGTVVGGMVARVMRPSRMEQTRLKADQERRDRILDDLRTLSDTLLEHSVRGGRGESPAHYPRLQKLGAIRMVVGRLEQECPELFGPLHQISRHFDQSEFVTPEEARQFLHPLNNQVRDLLAKPGDGKK
jgi:hypothetical protein